MTIIGHSASKCWYLLSRRIRWLLKAFIQTTALNTTDTIGNPLALQGV